MINLAHKPVIEGEKIILRPFKTEDVPLLEKILTDKEVILLTGSDDNIDLAVTRQWYQTRNDQTDRLDLAIVDKETDRIVGEVVLNEYDEASHTMNFRILIGKEGRNRGFGSEATKLFCNYIFEHTDLNALTLSVFAFNPRAKHVYEKAGFEVTSVDKNELEHEGEMIDSINMKLTRDKHLKHTEE